MRVRGGARAAAWLLCASASAAVCASPALAQQAQQSLPPLDPSAPLDPMPDIGVDWPDLATEAPGEPLANPSPLASAPVADVTTKREYSIAINGIHRVGNAAELVEAFEQQSVLFEGDEEEANAAQIQRRSQADAELLAELLRSRGYYDAEVAARVEPEGQTLLVTLNAEPGEQYHFKSVELAGLEAAGPEAARLREAFAVKPGDPVVAQDVIAANVNLKVALGEQGFALATVGEQEIIVDHQTRQATLVLPVTPGPLASFGTIRVAGNPPFSARHVAAIARFEPGDRFERDEVDDLRRALVATGLVSTAEVEVVPAAGNRVDLTVTMQPAPPRTVAGQLGYGSGEGLRAEASWQHRNFIRPEGAVTVRGILGTREQLAGVGLRRNNFGGRDRVLNAQLVASNTEFAAYDAKTIMLAANIERQSNIIWRKKWTWSLGTEFLATDERGVFSDPAVEQTRTFLIAALPATLHYDGSDDLLNPTSGFRLGGRLSPEISARGGSFTYARAQIDGSAYQPVGSNAVVAGRVRLGTILGADAPSIAPSRRFYSGGGGSVRGYGYQRLGPRDFEGDPIGGRGLVEFSLETRLRFSSFGGNFGIVPFLDGGTLSNRVTPDLNDWQFGAGLGLRYYSSFGPIRVDVGTPLNPRQGDSRIAVAVSLGQAF